MVILKRFLVTLLLYCLMSSSVFAEETKHKSIPVDELNTLRIRAMAGEMRIVQLEFELRYGLMQQKLNSEILRVAKELSIPDNWKISDDGSKFEAPLSEKGTVK